MVLSCFEVLRYLRKGDQLIVKSMDRLARSLVDLHTIVESLDSSEEFHGAGHIKKLDVGEEATEMRRRLMAVTLPSAAGCATYNCRHAEELVARLAAR